MITFFTTAKPFTGPNGAILTADTKRTGLKSVHYNNHERLPLNARVHAAHASAPVSKLAGDLHGPDGDRRSCFGNFEDGGVIGG